MSTLQLQIIFWLSLATLSTGIVGMCLAMRHDFRCNYPAPWIDRSRIAAAMRRSRIHRNRRMPCHR